MNSGCKHNPHILVFGEPVRRRTGFTLIELLVVISILGILIALLLPAVQAAREAARRTQCKSNLRQLGIALHLCHDTNSSFPPGSIKAGPAFRRKTGWGWGAMILPYIEQRNLHAKIDFNAGSAERQNARDVLRHSIPLWHCPSAQGKHRL